MASHLPPDEGQRHASTFATSMHHRYAPLGHFLPWAKLSFPEFTSAYRFAYPTLLCANNDHAFLRDVRTGVLVQTIDLDDQLRESGDICYIDVNERHALVCTSRALHVYARDRNAIKVLEVPSSSLFNSILSWVVESGNSFFSVLSLHPGNDDVHPNFLAGVFPAVELGLLTSFSIAHVSRDGRDLVVLTTRSRVIFIQDFERICRGEISLALAGQVLFLSPRDRCFYLAFEHGRVCVATVRVFSTDSTLLACHLSLSKLLFPSFSFLPSLLQLYGLYVVDVDRSTSIGSAKVVQKSCSCALMSTMPLGYITPSPACSSPIVAFILRRKTQDVGTMSLCTQRGKTL